MTGCAPSHAYVGSVNGQGRGEAKRGEGEGDRDQSIDKAGGGGERSRLKTKTTGVSHLFIFYRRLSFFNTSYTSCS